jgi:hypothetical protein
VAKPLEYAKYRQDHVDGTMMKHPNPRKHRSIRRLHWSPDRAGMVGMLVSAIIAVTIFATVVIYYPFLPQRNASAGFGPDWDCTPHPGGEPTCIKKIGR